MPVIYLGTMRLACSGRLILIQIMIDSKLRDDNYPICSRVCFSPMFECVPLKVMKLKLISKDANIRWKHHIYPLTCV